VQKRNDMRTIDQEMIIAVDGPGGGGKTTLARQIADSFGLDPETHIIHGDDYYEHAEMGADVVEGAPAGFNSRRFVQEIGQLASGALTKTHIYDFSDHSYIERPSPDPGELIIVEGVKILDLPINWDVKIWVETPRAIRQERFLRSPESERKQKGVNQETLLRRFNLWADDMDEYERTTGVHARNDVTVVDGTANVNDQISIVKRLIETA
jgi:uridine kinase